MSEEPEVEETNSGVRKKGDLDEVASFARDVEQVMQEEDLDEESVKRFEEWMPREEDGKDDIKRKTVDAATLSEKQIEDESNGVKDFAEAGNKAFKAGKKIKNGEKPGREVKDASKKFLQPLYSLSAKAARRVEERVYSNLMLKFNPYFFDSEGLSADLRDRKNDYVIDVNVSDKSSRDALKDRLARDK